jgi:prevent-host-death family protein
VKTISQRELRNDNAKVIRDVEEGETYTVTRRGVRIARLGPIDDDIELRCLKPARKRLRRAELRRVRSSISTAEVLDDLRGDR